MIKTEYNLDPPKNILIVDHQPVVIFGLKAILEQLSPLVVLIEEAMKLEQAKEMMASRSYDVVIADMNLPEIRWHDFLLHTRKKYPYTEVIFKRSEPNENIFVSMYRYGIKGVFSNQCDPEKIIKTIENVVCGQPSLDVKLLEKAFYAPRSSMKKEEKRTKPLSEKEKLVLTWMVFYKGNVKEVASELQNSVSTTYTQLNIIRHKLNLNTILDVVEYGTCNGYNL